MKLAFALLSIGAVLVAAASGKCLPVEPNTDYYGGDAAWHQDTGVGLPGRRACAQLALDNNGCAVHLGSHCWAKYGEACISSNINAPSDGRNAITQTATSTMFQDFNWNGNNDDPRVTVQSAKECQTACEADDKYGCCVFLGSVCHMKLPQYCVESAKIQDPGKVAILKNSVPGVTMTTWRGVEFNEAATNLGPASSLGDCRTKCRAADNVKCCTFHGAGCWAHKICPSASFTKNAAVSLILKNECATVTTPPTPTPTPEAP